MDNEEEEEPMAPFDDTSDIDLEYPVEGEALVTRRVLNTQVKRMTLRNNVRTSSIPATTFKIRCVV